MKLVSITLHTMLALALIVLMCQCTREKANAPVVQAIVETPDGSFWVATDNGLFRTDSLGTLRQQPLPSLTHHPFPSIHALAVDTIFGRLWVGAWNHLYCYDLKRERFVTTADSVIHQTPYCSATRWDEYWQKPSMASIDIRSATHSPTD